jgi:hypothetical protein
MRERLSTGIITIEMITNKQVVCHGDEESEVRQCVLYGFQVDELDGKWGEGI